MSKLREMLKYLVPFLLAVFLFSLINDFDKTWNFISSIITFLMFILSRFILGFGLAYILNFMARFLKRRFRFPNWLAIVSAYLIFLGTIAGLVVYLVPYISSVVEELAVNMDELEQKARELFQRYGLVSGGGDILSNFFDTVAAQLDIIAKDLTDISTIAPAVLSVGRTLMDITFGLLISVYTLIEKETLLRSGRRILYALSKGDKGEKRLKFLKEANVIFSQFIVGKFIDSLIVAAVSGVLYIIFGLELVPLLIFITFVFNMLPYFGPIIGTGITVLLMFFVMSPLYALYALIICVAVQALDGSFIGPKILGSAVGISPLLTIVAISVGGDLGGLLGIFLGIPILAMLKVLVLDKYVSKRMALKDIASEEWAPPEAVPREKKGLRNPWRKK